MDNSFGETVHVWQIFICRFLFAFIFDQFLVVQDELSSDCTTIPYAFNLLE